MLVCKAVGQVVTIDNVEKLQEDLKNDYIISNALSSSAGKLVVKSGSLLAAATAAANKDIYIYIYIHTTPCLTTSL